MNDRSPDLLKPTLIAGVLFGVLGGLPVVRLLNCFCCALVIGCGLLAAYLYSEASRRAGVAFRPGTGAMAGLVAGAFYAMTTTIVGAIVSVTIGDVDFRALFDFLRKLPNLPSESRDAMDRAMERSGDFSILGLIGGYLLSLLISAIFSTIGGLIGGAVFKVEPPPPPPPAPPPSPYGTTGGLDAGTGAPPYDPGI